VACKIARYILPRSFHVLVLVLPARLMIGTTRLASAEEPEPNPPVTIVPTPTASEASGSEHDEPLARARAVVAVAERLFLAGQYAAALAEYSRAYEILDGHPRQYWVLHNLASCNERMFRYDVAVELYEEYLRRAPLTEDDRGEVSAILETLRSLLATLVVESSVAGEVWLDDRRLGAAPGRWRVPAGRHLVEVRANSYESQRREVQLNAGQLQVDRFQLRRLSVNAGPPPAYFWAAVGLTGVATVVGTTAGLKALNAREQGRHEAALYLDTQQDAERTRRWALATDVSFGAAALFGATATVLYFVTDWQKPSGPERRAHEASSHRSLSVALFAPGGFGATLAGGF
jgi:hypothetical protein